MSIETVKEKNEERLMRLANVTGVGIGEKGGKEVIKVFVTHKVPESALQPQEVVPKRLEEYETDVEGDRRRDGANVVTIKKGCTSPSISTKEDSMWRGFRSVWVAVVSLSCFVFDARANPMMEMVSGLPMPPAAGEVVSNAAVGVKGTGIIRFSLPDPWAYAVLGNIPSDDPGQFAYFRYTNVAGKTLKISSNWAINSANVPGGGSGIPDPTGRADACAHAHHFWGVWAKYNRGGDSYWGFVHYGGKIGRRVDGVCQVSEFDDPADAFDDDYTWGLASYTWQVDSDATEIIVAAQSLTHGWGTRWGLCGEFVCYDQVMVEVMHLP